ncbi:MAG: lipopolysaccharide biosynthesis protein [Pseudomonadota bacterium]|nr:lipopolysaccharide biosynthesis protein [Pseudomonadota bacterium]MDP2351049.1 lipopolysaccharide biosynthesis protein [Pseudomonadota bacterium]
MNDNNQIGKRAVRGIAWVTADNVIHLLAGFVVLAILARMLSPSDFGVVGAAMVVLGISQILGQIGVGPALVQLKDITPRFIATGFWMSIAMGLVLGLVVFLLSQPLALLMRMPQLEDVLKLLAWIFPLSSFGLVATALLQRELKFFEMSLAHITSYLMGYALVGVVLASLGWGVWSLVWAQISQVLLYSSMMLWISRQHIRLNFGIEEAKILLNFGFGHSLGKLANFSATNVDNIVVGRWLGADALGIYGRVYQFMVVPANMLGNVVDKVLFPTMASVQDDRNKLSNMYLGLTGVVTLLAAPISAILFTYAHEIVDILLGNKWGAVVAPMQIFSLVLIFRAGYKFSDSLARATGAVYRRAWRQALYALAVLCGALIGQSWGLVGVAVGVSLAIILNYYAMLQLSLSLLQITFMQFVKSQFPYMALFVLMYIFAYWTRNIMLSWHLSAAPILLLGLLFEGLFLSLVVYFYRKHFPAEVLWLWGKVTNVVFKKIKGPHK